MNALFSVVTNEEFKKISSTETSKEAWTILQINYKGTKDIKDSKLQRLTTSFKEIKMEEDESFDELYAKLKDIVNSAFNLGETIPEPKIMRKVLRSLPKRFHAKITTIEELKDIDKIPLTELVGNLQTYKLGLTRIGKLSKSKSVALKAKSSYTDESSDNEDSKMKSYITKKFKKFMKNANGKGFDKDRRQSSSLSLSLFYVSLLLWHLNANLLRPKILYILGHLFPLTSHLLLFDSKIRTPERTSRRTFVDEAFIQNATLFCQTFLTLTYPLSFTIRVGSHFVTF